MTKTINLELSKKLNDLGLLDGIETEYALDNKGEAGELIYAQSEHDEFGEDGYIKTLTLEEAIEFLPVTIEKEKYIDIFKTHSCYKITYGKGTFDPLYIEGNNGETLLEVIEKMIEYLLDNNLLPND